MVYIMTNSAKIKLLKLNILHETMLVAKWFFVNTFRFKYFETVVKFCIKDYIWIALSLYL